jgi:CubicO group peptidase (beta-lactamase class C family)
MFRMNVSTYVRSEMQRQHIPGVALLVARGGKKSLEQMWTPAKLKNGQPNKEGYGFGWSTGDRHGHHVISHTGAWQGFKSAIARYVNDQLTVVVLANLDEAKPGEIAEHVADMYLAEGKNPAGKN